MLLTTLFTGIQRLRGVNGLLASYVVMHQIQTSSLRIIHCLRAPVGGLFRHVRDLATAQAARGHQVGVIADSNAHDRLTEQRLADLTPHLALGLTRVAMTRDLGWNDVTAYREIRSLLARLNVNILHGHGAKGGAYARLVGASVKAIANTCNPTQLRVFYTPHGGSLHYPPSSLKGRIYLGLERRLAASTDGLIFESAYSSRIFAANAGADLCPSAVIPNGVLAAEFGQHIPAENATDIVFIGELRHLKGVDVLLQAMAQLRLHQNRALTATIVGDGPDAGQFKALTMRLGLDRSVHFTGAMPAAKAFPLGRVLVMPSRAESFPYIVLEAAATAIPLLATAVGGIPEITAGTDTPLITPDDVMALANGLDRTFADLPAAQQRALRLQQSVAQRFTVETMTTAILGMYGVNDAQPNAVASHRLALTAAE
jgi:glycosyltransferase involved in cell wall biosynthesis